MEIQASPSLGTPLFPPGLYADVSSVCAVQDVEIPVQGQETPVQGPEVPSPQLPLSAQEKLVSPLTFSSSEITKGVIKAKYKKTLFIYYKLFLNIFLGNVSFG